MYLVDIIGSVSFLLFTFIIYKKAWFYSFYSFVKFLLISSVSFFSGLYLSSHNPYSFPLTALQQALIIQLFLFIVLWRIFSFKHIFFVTMRKVFDLDRFIFTHHLDPIMSIFPSVIASFFLTFFLFTAAVSLSPKSSFLTSEIDRSKFVKPVFYSIYFYPSSLNLAFFNGTIFKINAPAFTTSGVNLSQITDKALLTFREKLDKERIKENLFTLPAFEKVNPESQMFKNKPTYAPPPNNSSDNPTVVIRYSPTPIPNPYTYYYPTSTPYIQPTSAPYVPQPTTAPYNPQPGTPPSNPEPTATPTPTQAPPSASVNISEFEQEIFTLTNEQRQKNGVAPLTFSNEIAAVARAHSKDMNDRNFFDHNNPDGLNPFQRMQIGGISFSTAGENIAGGQTPSIMMTNWMNSPGHKANILSPAFHKIGVGVSVSSRYGFLATQDFTN